MKKLIHGKDNKLYVKWKGFNNSFNSWIDNIAEMSEYFQKLKSLGVNVNVEIDLSNYESKADLKNATGVDTSDFSPKKTNLATLKSDIDKLSIDKLKNCTK